MQRNSMPAAAAGAAAADGERWDSFPIYLGGSESRPFHLVKFLSTLPLAYGTTAAPGAAGAAAPSAAAAASSAAAAAATPAMRPGELGVLPPPSASSTAAAAAAAANSAKLLFPFAKETRLVSPRHVDFRSKFIQRKKVMKQALPSNAGAGAVAAAAAKADDKAAAADGEGVNPLDRKWRLEDAHPRTQRNAPSYIGAHEPVPRKEIHQQQPNHFVLLMRHEGRFTLVPADNYAFRHVDAAATGPGAILTLEEAEQKMKTRMRRFEKRVRGMATLQAQNDEEEGGPSAGGGGGGGGGGGMALERARPTLTGKIQPAPREDKADDAFSEMGVIMGKGGAQPLGLSAGARKAVALARAAKLKREGGADYTRQFDDDDVDFGGEDRLDGQGGEADEEMRDEEEILREEQAAQEAANEALERANKLALARKPGMSMDEVEQQAMAEEEAEEGALSEGEGDDDKGPAAGGAASKSSKKDVASESSSDDESDYDDEDLSLEDDEEEEEEESELPSGDSFACCVERAATGFFVLLMFAHISLL